MSRSGEELFVGDGEVRALARSIDWASTPLGPVREWPQTLRDVTRICLDSPFPMALWCGSELVLIYNDAYRELLGAKHPQALGRRGQDVWSEIWEEIQPFFDQVLAGEGPVFKRDASFSVQRSNGDAPAAGEDRPNAWFTFSLSTVRDGEGRHLGFLNIVSEITRRVLAERAHEAARKKAERAEARLREVFAQAPSFLAVLRGRDHVFEYVNDAYYQLVGHRDLVGRPVFEALPEVRGQGFEELLDEVLETGEPFVGREVQVMLSPTPDSKPEERFVDLVYYPLTEAGGARTGVVAHGSDVTEHVLARRDAQRARAEAEQANLAKSQFLATMSHEIRTPINAVLGYADLLDAGVSGELSDGQQDYVDGIAASSRHLRALVSEILDLAKIEAGEMDVSRVEMHVRPVIEAALRLVAPQAERRGLTLAETWDCDPGVQVSGDEDRIRQILLNLLSNALKFTDAGGSVTVTCGINDRPPADAALPEVGPWVVINITDTGHGIPPEQLERMFEPFVQAEAGHTRRAGGTGLGLTISRRLARLIGGELTVRSVVDKGSSFSLWLPSAVQERVSAALEDGAQPAPWPPEPHERPGLAAAGRTLLSVLDAVERDWVDRLRADPVLRAGARVTRAQLADQTAEFLAAIAKALFILEEGGGDQALLADAESIRMMVARRHAQQRLRLGWSRGEVEREYVLLAETLDDFLRREAPKRTAANLGTALAIVHRLVDRSAATCLAEFDALGAASDS